MPSQVAAVQALPAQPQMEPLALMQARSGPQSALLVQSAQLKMVRSDHRGVPWTSVTQ